MRNQYKQQNDWQKKNLDRVVITVPKGEREQIKAHAAKKGYRSTNAYLKALIKRDAEQTGI